jgi:hypothetical protein
VGKQTLFRNLQITNLQILGLIQQSQILKFLRCARSQIAKSTNFYKMLHNSVSNSTKSIKCHILKEKSMYLRASGSFKSAYRKSVKCDICGRSANLTNLSILRICDLRTYLRTSLLFSLGRQNFPDPLQILLA